MLKNINKILITILLCFSLAVLMTACDSNEADDGEQCASCNTDEDCDEGLVCAEFSDGNKRCARQGENRCPAN